MKEILFEKSFASNPKSKFWSDKNKLKPQNVTIRSGKKYLFNCNICNHEFETSPDTVGNGNWCPYCGNTKLCENNDCKECFNKSFACNEKSIFWSKLNELQARNVFKNSNKKYKFDCNNCNHIFEILLYVVNDQNCWCNFCANRKLCENEDCKDCFEKSFANSPKAVCWSVNNDITPRKIFNQTNKKYLMICNKCDKEFDTSPNKINAGKWCPFCKNKTEALVYEFLLSLYETKRELNFDWCKKKYFLPFDFLLVDKNIIIELDGRQHFQQVSNWNNPEETLNTDVYKMKCAIENNYTIIRIQQELVFDNKIDWKNILQNYIEKEYIIPSIIFIGDNRYQKHIIEITKLNIPILKNYFIDIS